MAFISGSFHLAKAKRWTKKKEKKKEKKKGKTKRSFYYNRTYTGMYFPVSCTYFPLILNTAKNETRVTYWN